MPPRIITMEILWLSSSNSTVIKRIIWAKRGLKSLLWFNSKRYILWCIEMNNSLACIRPSWSQHHLRSLSFIALCWLVSFASSQWWPEEGAEMRSKVLWKKRLVEFFCKIILFWIEFISSALQIGSHSLDKTLTRFQLLSSYSLWPVQSVSFCPALLRCTRYRYSGSHGILIPGSINSVLCPWRKQICDILVPTFLDFRFAI